jgi:hypothetical protein
MGTLQLFDARHVSARLLAGETAQWAGRSWRHVEAFMVFMIGPAMMVASISIYVTEMQCVLHSQVELI